MKLSVDRFVTTLTRGMIAISMLVAVPICVVAASEVSARQTIAGLLNEYERELSQSSFKEVPVQQFADGAVATEPPVGYLLAELARRRATTAEQLGNDFEPAGRDALMAEIRVRVEQAEVERQRLKRAVVERSARDSQLSKSHGLISTFRRRLQRLEATGGSDGSATAESLMDQFIEERQFSEANNEISEGLLNLDRAVLSSLEWRVREFKMLSGGEGISQVEEVDMLEAASEIYASVAELGPRFAQPRAVSTQLQQAVLTLRAADQAVKNAIWLKAAMAAASAATDGQQKGAVMPASPSAPVQKTANDDAINMLELQDAASRVQALTSSLRVAITAAVFPSPQSESGVTVQWIQDVALARTTTLLAAAVVLSGLIGSVISSMRTPGEMRLGSLALGLAAGFVTFLAIRGGKAVLLAESGGNTPALNPYGFAFVGLLAGLFTERGYVLLSYLVEQLIARVRAAMDSQTSSQQPAPAQRSGADGGVATAQVVQFPGPTPGEAVTAGVPKRPSAPPPRTESA